MRSAPARPTFRRFTKRLVAAIAAAVATTTAVAGMPSSALAADASPVAGTGKGIVGGALLGGELGFIGLSVGGAKQTWLYYVVPGALAIGGGIGGYFVEKGKEGTDAQAPMFMLAGGMALIIPTVVITLSANAYQPGSEDGTPVDATPADAGSTGLGVKVNTSDSTNMGSPSAGGGGTTTTTPTAPPPKRKPANTSSAAPISRPQAVFNLSNFDELTTIKVGLPVIALRPMYTKTEMSQFNQPQRYEVTAPVVSVAF